MGFSFGISMGLDLGSARSSKLMDFFGKFSTGQPPALEIPLIHSTDEEFERLRLALRCTIVLSDGVVNSQTDGLPSMPVDFGEFFFFLKECRVPPQPKLVHW